jgi:predicted secreted protein
MDQLADEVSHAQAARIKREKELLAKQQQAQEDAKQCKFFDDVANEVQYVKQQISDRRNQEIIVFSLNYRTPLDVQINVLNQIIKSFESKATIVSLIYDGKWDNDEYFYEKLKSNLQAIPRGKDGYANKFAIEYNTNVNKKFVANHGTIDGKCISQCEK